LIEIRDQDHAIKDRNATERDKPDSSGNAKGQATQDESEDTAGDGKRYSRINDERLAQAAERAEDQDEDQSQDERHDNREPSAGGLKIFELSAQLDIIARRQLKLTCQFLPGFAGPALDITPAQIHKQGGATLAGFAIDGADSFDHGNI